MRTATVTSAGGIVFDAGSRVLMIARRSLTGQLQWTLPKGLVEAGETAETAAVREVLEETGVAAEITGPPRTIEYWFVWKADDTRYHKFVRYFPMRETGRRAGSPDGEAERIEWVPAAEAAARASFPNEQAALRDTIAAGGEVAPAARPRGASGRKAGSAPQQRGARRRNRAEA